VNSSATKAFTEIVKKIERFLEQKERLESPPKPSSRK